MQVFATINEKKYYPSSVLSEVFGYTADYIGKLAREEKILGLLIERQWFIEKNSLEVYLQKIRIEKQIQKDTLSATRKKERMSYSRQKRDNDTGTDISNRFLVATAEALTIMICGVLVGGLGWISSSQDLTPKIFVQGMQDVASFASKQMAPTLSGVAIKSILSPESHQASVPTASQVQSDIAVVSGEYEVVQTTHDEGLVFTQLPVPEDVVADDFTMQAMKLSIAQIRFSDTVDVAVDASGEYYLKPVSLQGEESSVFLVQAQTGVMTSQ
jgi:hypothetical protein